MAVEIITVRKKTNPAITRKIKSSALNTFSKRGWEAAPGQAVSTAANTEVKKKDVEPAESPAVETQEETAEDSQTETFATISDEPEREKSLDDLRAEYKTLSGKDADKRWKADRLSDEISKLANGN